MSNLIEIQSQIQKLQKQADDIKAKEFDKTVQDILAKMQAFGISIKDLQSVTINPRKGRGRPPAEGKVKIPSIKKKAASNPVAAKYRGPNGESWSGRGLTPRWLSALLAQGQTKEAFAISNAEQSPEV
jgi:DNA-binding protein H-NS